MNTYRIVALNLCIFSAVFFTQLMTIHAQLLPQWSEGQENALIPREVLFGGYRFDRIIEVEDAAALEAQRINDLILEPYLEAYFSSTPESYLIDPEQQLTEQERADTLAFFEYHAANADIDLYLYLFQADAEIPQLDKMQKFIGGLFSRNETTAVVFYAYGKPEKSQLLVVGENGFEVNELREAIGAARIKASDKSNPLSQLSAFNVQLSISLYWLEDKLPKPLVYSEVVVGEEKPVVEHKAAESKYASLVKLVSPYIGYGLGGIAVAALVVLLWLRWRRNRTYQFPIIEVPKRLAADYAAGVGSVISFQNQRISLASQRDQELDYFPYK